jgi:uncharacterized protein
MIIVTLIATGKVRTKTAQQAGHDDRAAGGCPSSNQDGTEHGVAQGNKGRSVQVCPDQTSSCLKRNGGIMSQNDEIVEACRLAYNGFERNNRDKLLTLLSPDVIFEFPNSLPYGGSYKGIEEYKAFWTDLYENYYESFNYDAHAVLDAGTHVVVPVVAKAIGKNGRTMENEHCFVFKVENGRIVYGRIYADTAKGRDLIEGMTLHRSRATG